VVLVLVVVVAAVVERHAADAVAAHSSARAVDVVHDHAHVSTDSTRTRRSHQHQAIAADTKAPIAQEPYHIAPPIRSSGVVIGLSSGEQVWMSFVAAIDHDVVVATPMHLSEGNQLLLLLLLLRQCRGHVATTVPVPRPRPQLGAPGGVCPRAAAGAATQQRRLVGPKHATIPSNSSQIAEARSATKGRCCRSTRHFTTARPPQPTTSNPQATTIIMSTELEKLQQYEHTLSGAVKKPEKGNSPVGAVRTSQISLSRYPDLSRATSQTLAMSLSRSRTQY